MTHFDNMPPEQRWRKLGEIALITMACAIPYAPAVRGGFIWDDYTLLTNNRLIRATDGLSRIWFTTQPVDYWPVSNSSLWLEWRLWGRNPIGYHMVSIALHSFAAVLVWLILRRLRIPGALLAALLFAVHPVNVETVAWIAQRKTLLAMVFFLLALWAYLQDERGAISAMPQRDNDKESSLALRTNEEQTKRGGRWYWLSLSAFVLAMLSKGSVAMLPVVLLLVAWWERGRIVARDLRRIAPFFVVAAGLTAVNVWFQAHDNDMAIRHASLAERLAGAGAIVWFYLFKALAPLQLTFVYPQWAIEPGEVRWWLPLVATVLVSAVLWWQRDTVWGRAALLAWGFFCAALVPVLGFADVGFMKWSLVADHYQYVAIIGVAALVAAGWSTWERCAPHAGRIAAVGIAAAVLGGLSFLTWRQSQMYQNEELLWRTTIERNPDFWIAYDNLGMYYLDKGQVPAAIDEYKKLLSLKPDFAEAHNNFGLALLQAGRTTDATEQFELALHYRPHYADAHNNLGSILAEAGQVADAKQHFDEALALDPNSSDAENNLGNALVHLGRFDEAIEHFQRAIELAPDSANAYNNLAVALIRVGQPQNAIAPCLEALRLQPDMAEAHYNAGWALTHSNRPAEAIEHFEHALRLRPNYPVCYFQLGNALLAANRPVEAIENFQQAINMSPDFAEAWANLAMVHVLLHQSNEALSTGERALELARTEGKTTLAAQLETALAAVRAGNADAPDNPPASATPPTTP